MEWPWCAYGRAGDKKEYRGDVERRKERKKCRVLRLGLPFAPLAFADLAFSDPHFDGSLLFERSKYGWKKTDGGGGGGGAMYQDAYTPYYYYHE